MIIKNDKNLPSMICFSLKFDSSVGNKMIYNQKNGYIMLWFVLDVVSLLFTR